MSQRAPKRRIIANEKRKRTVFSCDRCKQKKIACIREEKEDTVRSCIPCKKKGLKCTTSLKRKLKSSLPLENISLHYRCLISLLEDIYPQENINNIDVLIQLGRRRNIRMPDRQGLNEHETERIKKLVSSIMVSENEIGKNEGVGNSTEILSTKMLQLSFEFRRSEDSQKEKDTHLIDKGGNHHYIGPFGAPSFLLTLTNDIILKNCYFFGSSVESCNKLFYDTHPIGSERKKYVESSGLNHFLKPSISRSIADGYLNIFFDKIHPNFLCFSEIKFRDMSGRFWSSVCIQEPSKGMIPEINICLIYIVWVLGSLFYDTKQTNFESDIFIKNSLLVIDYFIPKMLIAPCLESIQCLMLLSIYYEMNGLKESGHVLLELVLSQAGSIGLYRNSFIMHSKDQTMAEELIITWWTLFQHAVRVNTQMGRSLELPSNQITIQFPLVDLIRRPTTEAAWIDGVKLASIFCPTLKYRSEANSLELLLNSKQVDQAITTKEKMISWYENLSYSFSDILTTEQSYNLILFHYYMLSISFPFLLTITKSKITTSAPVFLDLIKLCFESSYNIFLLSKSRDRLGHSNGLFSPDVFFIYNAVLCLVTCDVWLKLCEASLVTHDIRIAGFEGPIDRLVMSDWFKSLKEFIDALLPKSRGTQLTVCTFTSAFLEAVVQATDGLENKSIEDFLSFWREETATHSFASAGEAIFRIEDFS